MNGIAAAHNEAHVNESGIAPKASIVNPAGRAFSRLHEIDLGRAQQSAESAGIWSRAREPNPTNIGATARQYCEALEHSRPVKHNPIISECFTIESCRHVDIGNPEDRAGNSTDRVTRLSENRSVFRYFEDIAIRISDEKTRDTGRVARRGCRQNMDTPTSKKI